MNRFSVPVSDNIEQALNRSGYLVMSGTCRFPQPMWHRHAGLEISLVHTGVAHVFSSNWRASMVPGDALFSPSDVAHGSQGEFNRTVLHFVPELAPQQYRHVIDRLYDSTGRLDFVPDPDASYRFIWATQEMAKMHTRKGTLPTAQALLGVILADMKTSLSTPTGRDVVPEDVRQLMAYMQANPESDLTVDTLIQRFELSRSVVFDQFAEYLGSSPGAYWEKIRLDHACRLLVAGGRVRDVATKIGFHSLRGFQRAFRRRYDMTPSQYREANNQSHGHRALL